MDTVSGKVVAFIGLIAAITALLQTFSVKPLPEVKLIVRCAPPNPMSTMFNFIEGLGKHNGGIILLELDYDSGCERWTYPRYVSDDRESISYEINWVDLARTDGLLDGSPKGKSSTEMSQWMTDNFWKKLPLLKSEMIKNHSFEEVDQKNIVLFN